MDGENGFPKAIRLSDGTIVGMSGDMRDGDIIYANIESLGIRADLTHNDVINVVVPAVFEMLDRHGRIVTDERGHKEMDSHILIATAQNLFVISPDGFVIAGESFVAIGAVVSATICFDLLKNIRVPVYAKLLRIADALCNRETGIGYPIHLLAVGEMKGHHFNDSASLYDFCEITINGV